MTKMMQMKKKKKCVVDFNRHCVLCCFRFREGIQASGVDSVELNGSFLSSNAHTHTQKYIHICMLSFCIHFVRDNLSLSALMK